MEKGVIVKAISGFYTVATEQGPVECRARGRFRREGVNPLVGDVVSITETAKGRGVVEALDARRTVFVRPSVANIDLLVVVASAVNPVSDPYLIDRVSAIAVHMGCDVLVCINKTDLDPGDALFEIYEGSGLGVLRTSVVTGSGIEELRKALVGRISAFTGNSGAGKSSLLNVLDPTLCLPVGELSLKLGRGRHTTRHVELHELSVGTFIADTPGFSSFEMAEMEPIRKNELQYAFPDFVPFLGTCRFKDCAHLREPGCAVTDAVCKGRIHPSRHSSYAKLYELASQQKEWEMK